MHFSKKLYIIKLKIFKNIEPLQKYVADLKKQQKSIGFVPTMGSLHDGHISLLKESTIHNQVTICSIYVNPKQFNDHQDFICYPRQEKKDIILLNNVRCDVLFMPSDNQIYPRLEEPSITYESTHVMSILEGEKRPGHFLGVLKIVYKLFYIINPDIAYFGEKDYQQLYIIREFVENMNINLKIESCATVRDTNGLALSSRNKNLTIKEKLTSLNIFKSLQIFKEHIIRKNINALDLEKLKENIIHHLQKAPLIKLDYFEVIENENFRFAKETSMNKNYRILIAAYVGKVRLIDNIYIEGRPC